MTEALPRVLLIEDDRELQGLLARLLARRFSVLTTDSSIDALAILDLGLPFVARTRPLPTEAMARRSSVPSEPVMKMNRSAGPPILCDLRLERLSGIDLYAKVLRLLKPFGRAALFDCIAGLAIPGRT